MNRGFINSIWICLPTVKYPVPVQKRPVSLSLKMGKKTVKPVFVNMSALLGDHYTEYILKKSSIYINIEKKEINKNSGSESLISSREINKNANPQLPPKENEPGE